MPLNDRNHNIRAEFRHHVQKMGHAMVILVNSPAGLNPSVCAVIIVKMVHMYEGITVVRGDRPELFSV